MDFVPDAEVSDEETRPKKKVKKARSEQIKTRLNLKYDDGVTRMYAENCLYLVEGEPQKVEELVKDVKTEFPPLWYETEFKVLAEDKGVRRVEGFRYICPPRKPSEMTIVDRTDSRVYPRDVACEAVVYKYESFGRWGVTEFRISGEAQDVNVVMRRILECRSHWGYFPFSRTFENGTIAKMHFFRNCD